MNINIHITSDTQVEIRVEGVHIQEFNVMLYSRTGWTCRQEKHIWEWHKKGARKEALNVLHQVLGRGLVNKVCVTEE